MRIRSQSRLRYAWAFAIFWNLVSAPATFLGAVPAIQKGQAVAWVALIFPFAGAALLIWAIHLSLRFWRFGVSWLDLETQTAMLGGALRAKIAAPRLPGDSSILLTLTCINRTTTGTGENRSTWEKVVWQEEQTIAGETIQPGPDGEVIPVSFRLPFDAPPTGGDTRDRILWRLEARARLAGVDYQEQFEVPVAAAPPGKEPAGGDSVAARPAPARPETSRIVVEPGPEGGTCFILPARRNAKATLVSALYALLFLSGMCLFLFLGSSRTRDPLFTFFFWLFGIMFVPFCLLIVVILLHTAFVRSRVTVTSSGLVIDCRVLGLSWSLRAARSEVRDVTLHVGMQVGMEPYYDLKIARAAGRPLTLPAMLRNKREAEWLASEIKRALR